MCGTDEGIHGSTRQRTHIHGTTGVAAASKVRVAQGDLDSFHLVAVPSARSLDQCRVSATTNLNYFVSRVADMLYMLNLLREKLKNL